MEIGITTGREYSIMRQGEAQSIYDGEALKIDAFAVCRQKNKKIVVIFDEVINHEDIKSIADNKLFLEEARFQIRVDGKRKAKDDFEATILNALLWIVHHEEEFGL